jgi:hypothetical protein
MLRSPRAVLVMAVAGCAAMLLTTPALSAQVTPAVERVSARARALVDSGDGATARVLMDSLVGAVPAGTADFAEALYWRAVLAEGIGDAERDWKRLVIDVPLSPRTPDALVRLGELDMLRGHPTEARVYFTRLLRDFPAGPYRTKGLLWLTRSYFDERNLTGGCTALDSLRRVEIPDGELKLQSDELQRRCVGVPRTVAPVAPPAVVATPAATPVAATPVAGSGRYSVQLAAYFTRAEAAAAVQRFTQRDIAARVDGEQKPFRVRVGYYATRADAVNALNRLKKLGLDGFVAELAP